MLQLVMDGMGWDKRKAQLWFNTPNPLLGGATPNSYELLRGSHKLEKFIREQFEQNVRGENPSIEDQKPTFDRHDISGPS